MPARTSGRSCGRARCLAPAGDRADPLTHTGVESELERPRRRVDHAGEADELVNQYRSHILSPCRWARSVPRRRTGTAWIDSGAREISYDRDSELGSLRLRAVAPGRWLWDVAQTWQVAGRPVQAQWILRVIADPAPGHEVAVVVVGAHQHPDQPGSFVGAAVVAEEAAAVARGHHKAGDPDAGWPELLGRSVLCQPYVDDGADVRTGAVADLAAEEFTEAHRMLRGCG